MGMPVSVLGRGSTSALAGADVVVAAAFAQLRDVDAMFSTYRDDSAVSAVRSGATSLAESPPAVRAVARLCTAATELTGGLFDATMPDGTWDPSGLVKGWAVERAARHLTRAPGLDWCLNAAGDIAIRCRAGEAFEVGVEDPGRPGRYAATFAVGSGGVATSGTAARGPHIYDPRTGRPADGFLASVTVAGPRLLLADVLATAAFVAGPGWAAVVASAPGYAAMSIGADGTIAAGPGWPRA